MGFLDKIFRRSKPQLNIDKQIESDMAQNTLKDDNVLKLFELKRMIDSLLSRNKYIAKSEYQKQVEEYSSVINFVAPLSA